MASPTSRDELIDYCKRSLGEPVIEVNVDYDQIEDRIDEALQYYRNYHSDANFRAYVKHQVSQQDLDQGYVQMSTEVMQVVKLFPIYSNFNNGRNFFDIKYQMMLNDMTEMTRFVGDLAYYEQMQQYLSTLDMKLNGTPIVEFSRKQNRLYIFGESSDGDLKAGDFIVAEVYQLINPESFTSVYDDMWLKQYATALIKRQWGQNLIKFDGMLLPGGVQINGRQIFEDALQDIERLEERIRLEHELPVDFFVG